MRLESVLAFLALMIRTHGFTLAPQQRLFTLRLRERAAMSHPSSSAEHDVASGDHKSEHSTFLLPWTDFQDWALRDNILKYVISIPRKGADKPEKYVLWRNLSREVLELSGYPVDMLQEKYRQQLVEEGGSSLMGYIIPQALPLLDEYEFRTSGGLSGRIYGIPGVAEGSLIETPSVSQVQFTLPMGYILTDDESVAYELGTPSRTEFYSLDGIDRSSGPVQSAGKLAKDVLLTSNEAVPGDDMLVRLGASTAILLAGATAVNLLSHHMTVNVFWV